MVIEGLPEGCGVRYATWRPPQAAALTGGNGGGGGGRSTPGLALAFVVRPPPPPHAPATAPPPPLELWVATLASIADNASTKQPQQQRCVAVRAGGLSGRTLQCVHGGAPQAWTANGRLVVRCVPTALAKRGPPRKPRAPTGPSVSESDGAARKPARTYQVLKVLRLR